MLAFIEEAQLDRVGCFSYSPVAGATANDLPGAVPDEVKEARRERFMAVQAKISYAKLKAQVGREMIVLVDKVEDQQVVARGPGDAPEIDGTVIIPGAWELEPGDFIEVKVTGAGAHDLFAEPTDPE